MRINNLKFRIYNKILKNINFKSFNLAKIITKFLFQSYNANSLNQYKIDAFIDNRNEKIDTPSLRYLVKTIEFYKEQFNKLPNSILDFGGATGENVLSINDIFKHNFQYYIVENQKLEELLKKNGLKHCQFLSKIPENTKFDIVYTSCTLMYVDNPYRILKQLSDHTKNILSLARLDCSEDEKVKIEVSFFKKNIGYKNYMHELNDSLALYTAKEISIKKIKSILNNFDIKVEEFLDDSMHYFIFKKQNKT